MSWTYRRTVLVGLAGVIAATGVGLGSYVLLSDETPTGADDVAAPASGDDTDDTDDADDADDTDNTGDPGSEGDSEEAPPGELGDEDGAAADDGVSEAEPPVDPGDGDAESPDVGAPARAEEPDPVDPDGGAPEEPEAAAALHAATVTRGDGGLAVRLELGGPPPDEIDELLVWSVEVVDAGEPRGSITVQQDGSRHVAALYDWDRGEQTQLDDQSVRFLDDVLEVDVPAEHLPDLGDEPAWAAITQLGGAWSARIPEGPHDPDAPFLPLDG